MPIGETFLIFIHGICSPCKLKLCIVQIMRTLVVIACVKNIIGRKLAVIDFRSSFSAHNIFVIGPINGPRRRNFLLWVPENIAKLSN